MKGKGTEIFVNFLVRAVIGVTLIFFVNQFLAERQMNIHVGINPITVITSGTLGVPGVALLYGVSFYHDGVAESVESVDNVENSIEPL